jgi:hypothetical protein
VWLLLFAMLAFRFGHGLYFPFSSIYFHNVLGIPLSLVGIGLAVFAAASVHSGLVAFVLFFTLAEMVLEVAGASLAAELAPAQLRGTYLGLFGACFGVACGFSPIVAGTLLEARLPALIWTIQLAASAAVGLGTLALLRRRRSVTGA